MKKIIFLFIGCMLLLAACGQQSDLSEYASAIDEIAAKNDELASRIAQSEDELESRLIEIDEVFDDGSKNLDKDEALKVAKEYVEYFSMSYDDLLTQLELEGFGEGVALYAANNCGADWEAEAVEAAELFKDDLSKDEISSLLKDNGFTDNEIAHALESIGY